MSVVQEENEMRIFFSGAMVASALIAGMTITAEASACGACFHQPNESTVVTGHRMVVSISPVQTVLWDQIQYSGDPAGFAWVLPVKPGAYVEAATDAWFETLEAGTKSNVAPPDGNCTSPSSGCGSDLGAVGDLSAQGGFAGVTVLHSGSVGPYETVTIETKTPGALETWLVANGYAVQADLAPTLDAYVAEGFQFIALRLAPSQGVNQMKPVRVVTPGASTTLPLRMVAGGTGASVPIVLYVITEGRFETVNFPGVEMQRDVLTWDFKDATSNYSEKRDEALAAGDKRGFLTAYAQPGALLTLVDNPVQGFELYAVDDRTFLTFSEAYFAQSRLNGELDEECSGDFFDLSESKTIVASPCPASVPFNSPDCTLAVSGTNATKFVCGDVPGKMADDLAVALVGLHPADVWVTRLEANLPRAALSEDLVLGPAHTQEPLSNWVRAVHKHNETDFCLNPLQLSSIGGSRDAGRRAGSAFGLGLGAIALAALGRRRARSRVALLP